MQTPTLLPLRLALGLLLLHICGLPSVLLAQSDWTPVPPRSVLVEVYYRSDTPADQGQLESVKRFAESRGGISVVARDLADTPKNRERLAKVLEHYELPADSIPAVYGCNLVLSQLADEAALTAGLEKMFRYDVYSRAGCQHCDEAKELLPEFLQQYPAFRLRVRDVDTDSVALKELNQLLAQEKHGGASTPAMFVCNQLLIGFDRTNNTPRRLHQTLSRWTVPDQKQTPADQAPEVADQLPF